MWLLLTVIPADKNLLKAKKYRQLNINLIFFLLTLNMFCLL